MFFILSFLTFFISESQTKHVGLASHPAWFCAPQNIAIVVVDPCSRREVFFHSENGEQVSVHSS